MNTTMPKRQKGGQRKKKSPANHDLEYKDDGQDYAKVLRMLGNSRCEVQCMDGISRLAHIRGKMKNTIWISMGDYVLVGLRDFQDEKCDILLKYNDEDVRTLRAHGELPQHERLDNFIEEEVCNFDFDNI